MRFNFSNPCIGLVLLATFVGCSDSNSPSVQQRISPEKHAVHAVTKADFSEVVLQADKPVMVDFWAPWCGPCRALGPIVEEVASDYGDRAIVVKLNVDEAEELAKEYEISSIPALLVFSDGEVVSRSIGMQSAKELSELLAQAIDK